MFFKYLKYLLFSKIFMFLWLHKLMLSNQEMHKYIYLEKNNKYIYILIKQYLYKQEKTIKLKLRKYLNILISLMTLKVSLFLYKEQKELIYLNIF